MGSTLVDNMASLQAKLCLLLGHYNVFMTCNQAQKKVISERMKQHMQSIAQFLVLHLDPQDAQSPEYAKIMDLDDEDLHKEINRYWNVVFDVDECWTKIVIDESDLKWKFFYMEMKQLLKYASNTALRG